MLAHRQQALPGVEFPVGKETILKSGDPIRLAHDQNDPKVVQVLNHFSLLWHVHPVDPGSLPTRLSHQMIVLSYFHAMRRNSHLPMEELKFPLLPNIFCDAICAASESSKIKFSRSRPKTTS